VKMNNLSHQGIINIIRDLKRILRKFLINKGLTISKDATSINPWEIVKEE